MSWSTINVTEVLQEFTPQEKAAMDAIQGATTNLASILTRTVRAARGNISAGGNQLDATADTVPDQLRADVVCIARWKWLISFPQMKAMQTDARKADYDEAMKRLDSIANGKTAVEVPVNPAGNVSPATMPSVSKPTLKFSDEEGI